MKNLFRRFSPALLLFALVGTASAATYKEALQVFRSAGESSVAMAMPGRNASRNR